MSNHDTNMKLKDLLINLEEKVKAGHPIRYESYVLEIRRLTNKDLRDKARNDISE